MITDVELKTMIQAAFDQAVGLTQNENDQIFTDINKKCSEYPINKRNKLRSTLFVSCLGKELENVYPQEEMYNTGFIRLDDNGVRHSGEWLLDITVSKREFVEWNGNNIHLANNRKNRLMLHQNQLVIDTNLLWAVESESNVAWVEYAKDFRKLLCVKSQNYLYLNGMKQSADKFETYINERLTSVSRMMCTHNPRQNFYYGFWATPARADGYESIWLELDRAKVHLREIKLYKFNGENFEPV